MTELLNGVDTSSDAELIARVRGGDVAAYGELFSRHVEAANRLARQLARGPDVDDLVAEAFAKVLQVLQSGGGPDVAFRAYLLTAVRRLHVDRIRASAKLQPSDDMSQFDAGIPFQDTAVAAFENGAAAKAFASLPERWQLVLWHLEVEGQKPAEIAPLLGMTANSVSALAYRAREGLRQAFLTMHLNDTSDVECRWVNEHLGAYVRKGLSRRDSGKVSAHLDECRRCMAMYLELTEVNSNLSGIIAPLVLGAAAAGYLGSGSAAAGTGVFALMGNVKELVAGNATTVTVGTVAAGVVAVATAGFLFANTNDPDKAVRADSSSATRAMPSTAPTEAPAAEDAENPARGEPRGAAAQRVADLRIADVSADGGVLRLAVSGLPAAPITLTVALGSRSTTFAGASSDCRVLHERQAACTPPTLSFVASGTAVSRRVSTFEAAFPLRSSSAADCVVVSVDAVRYDERRPGDNTRTIPVGSPGACADGADGADDAVAAAEADDAQPADSRPRASQPDETRPGAAQQSTNRPAPDQPDAVRPNGPDAKKPDTGDNAGSPGNGAPGDRGTRPDRPTDPRPGPDSPDGPDSPEVPGTPPGTPPGPPDDGEPNPGPKPPPDTEECDDHKGGGNDHCDNRDKNDKDDKGKDDKAPKPKDQDRPGAAAENSDRTERDERDEKSERGERGQGDRCEDDRDSKKDESEKGRGDASNKHGKSEECADD